MIGSFVLLFFLLVTLTNYGAFGEMPSLDELENPKSLLATEVYSSDGVLLGKYYLENRSVYDFDETNPNLKNALLATEDVRFFDHNGIDYWGTISAMFSTLHGSTRGASTITQQLAKNLFTKRPSNSVSRLMQKFKEWIIAVKLERRFTKDEIINLYFNTVPFSDNAYGIKSAARTYFNTTPDSLKIEQCAVLVGMLKGSTLYNPKRNPKNSFNRRNVVLGQMLKYGYIKQHDFDSLNKIPIKLNYVSPDHNDGVAPYFREQLRMELNQWCKTHKKSDGTNYNIYKDGLKIYTTINYKMQLYAEQAVQKHMKELQKEFFTAWKGRKPWASDDFIKTAMKQTWRYISMHKAGISDDSIMKVFKTKIPMSLFSYSGDVDTTMSPWDSIKWSKMYLHQGFIVTDPSNGEILAWVGGIDHHHFQYDHVNLKAKRQVGSTIKPFLYTVAVENGMSPCMQMPNSPICIGNWCPHNSDGKYGGVLNMFQGLARSVNIISVTLMKQIGYKPMIDKMRQMGFTSPIPEDVTICVGTPDLSLMEMVGGYGCFANKGTYNKPFYISRIVDSRGVIIEEFKPAPAPAINEQVAYTMVKMLEGVIDRGTGVSMRYKFKINAEMGGKTGTTQKNTDGWFMCVTPQLCAGVWTGGEDRIIRFENTAYGQGANMSLPTFAYFLQKCYADKSLGISPDAKFDIPEDMGIELDCSKYTIQGGYDATHEDIIFEGNY